MTEKLNKQSVQGWLEKRPGWSVKKDCLVKEFRFQVFPRHHRLREPHRQPGR